MARGRKRATSTTSIDNNGKSSGGYNKNSNEANLITHIVLPPRRMITRSLLNGTSPALSELAESLHLETTLQTNTNNKKSNKNDKRGPNQTTNTLSLLASPSSRTTEKSNAPNNNKMKSNNVQHDQDGEQITSNYNNDNNNNSKSKYGKNHLDKEMHRQYTSSSSPTSSLSAMSPMSPRVLLLGGVLRCVCNAFLITPQETLLECCKCRNWCHPACVGVDHAELRHLQRTKTFLCPYCTGEESTNFHPAVMMLNVSEKGVNLSNSPSYSVAPAINKNGFPIFSVCNNNNNSSHWTEQQGENVKGKSKTAKRTKSEQLEQEQSHEEESEQKEYKRGNNNNNVQGSNMCEMDNLESVKLLDNNSRTTTYTLGRHPPAPRQIPLRLREVADHLPEIGAAYLSELLQKLHCVAHAMNYDVIDLPLITHIGSMNNIINSNNNFSMNRHGDGGGNNSVIPELTDKDVAQCVECCEVAIRDATFSETYPAYCLKEVRSHLHPYVQGTLLRCRKERKIRAMILSNGMDVYGNLKHTITQLKSAINRKSVDRACLTHAMEACLGIIDVSDFVHVTLSATHIKHQRRGLAKLLMSMELLKWALRGRTRAFLNMAIEKKLVEVVQTDSNDSTDSINNSNNKKKGNGNGKNTKSVGMKVEYSSPQASRRLYHLFNFEDVYPRHDPLTQSEKWTAKEADMGRVMVNLEFVPSVIRVAESIIHEHNFPLQQQNQQENQVEACKTRNGVLSLKYSHHDNSNIDCNTESNVFASSETVHLTESVCNEEKEKEWNVINSTEHTVQTNEQDEKKKVETIHEKSDNSTTNDMQRKEIAQPTQITKMSTITQLVNGRNSLSLYKRRRNEGAGPGNTVIGSTNNSNNNSETNKKTNSVKSTRTSKTITSTESSLSSSAPIVRRTNQTHDVKASAYTSSTRFSRPFSLTRMKNTKQLLVQHQQEQQQQEEQEEQ